MELPAVRMHMPKFLQQPMPIVQLLQWLLGKQQQHIYQVMRLKKMFLLFLFSGILAQETFFR